MTTGVSERATRFLEIARTDLAADRDHMVANAENLPWLIAQLTHYPIRVDPECTTNDRFLKMSAAATLLEKEEIISELVGALQCVDNDVRHHHRNDSTDAALIRPHAIKTVRSALSRVKGVKGG